MTALKVVLILLLVLFLLGRIRLGGAAEYSADGFRVWARVGALRVKVFPMKPLTEEERRAKEEKKAAKKTKQEAKKAAKKAKEESQKAKSGQTDEPQQQPSKVGGTLKLVKQYLPLVGEAAGGLKRRTRVDRLNVDFVAAGGDDPASAAMSFGYSSATYSIIWPIFEQNFTVKEHRFRTAVDFQAKEPLVYIYAAFSARLGQLVSFALILGWKFLKLYQSGKKSAIKQKEAI